MKFQKPLLFSLCLYSLSSYAERANDSDLAQSALEAAFRTSDPTILDQEVMRSRTEAVEEIGSALGTSKISATIVFSAGKTSTEVQAFIEENKFELIRAEAKNAIGDNGRVATISVGGRKFLLMSGSIAEKIDKSIGMHQLRLGLAAQNKNDETAGLLAETAYKGRLLIYAIEVIGEVRAFENVLSDNSLATVIVDADDEKIASYEIEREFINSVTKGSPPPIRRRLEDGPPPGVDPARAVWIGADPNASTRQ